MKDEKNEQVMDGKRILAGEYHDGGCAMHEILMQMHRLGENGNHQQRDVNAGECSK